MHQFDEFIEKHENPKHKKRFWEIVRWIDEKHPQLKREIKWNEPVYTDHGTFILSLNITKNHLSICPENKTIQKFEEELKKREYGHGMMIVKIKWTQDVPYDLLEKMIEFNIEDKKNNAGFWRKNN